MTTYKSRIHASKRLNRLNNRWNAALIAFATATTVASVGMLVNGEMYGRGGDTMMVALAVLSLTVSLVVSGVNYGVRAKAMESNYKRVQQLACEVENAKRLGGVEREAKFSEVQREYLYAVDSSENHSEGDYARTLDVSLRKPFTKRLAWETAMSWAPLAALLFPVAVLIPFVGWFVSGF